MIVNWITHDNRKRRRGLAARARKAGIDVAFERYDAGETRAHIVTLTRYLVNPNEDERARAAEVEHVRNVTTYLGADKDAPLPAGGERVLQVVTRNLFGETLEDRQLEMELVAGMSPGQDPLEHVVVSWGSGEQPSPEQVEEVIDILLRVTGMETHQVFGTLHGDTAHIHLHLAINRVDPMTGERHEFGRGVSGSLEALHQAIAVIARLQGWSTQERALYSADDKGCHDRGTGIQVLDDRLRPTAGSADWAVIRAARERIKREDRVGAIARRFEQRTGAHSLQRRLINDAEPALRGSYNWDEVHRRLGLLGMRYIILPSGGAVIDCDGRTLPASSAWGGASEKKMTARLGRFEAPPEDLEVAPFAPRYFTERAEQIARLRQRQALRVQQDAVASSADAARHAFFLAYDDQVASSVAQLGREHLNEARKEAAAAVAASRAAIDLLVRQHRARHRARRAALKHNIFGEEEMDESEDVIAMLCGSRGEAMPVEAVPIPDFTVEERDGAAHYYQADRLAFVERRDRIDIHHDSDASLRAALRLAKAKWGTVTATGDKAFLDRIAALAVEENVEITNLGKQMTRARAMAYRRQRQVAEAGPPATDPLASDPPAIGAALVETAAMPGVLDHYAPAILDWQKLAASDAPPAEIAALALSIMSDAKLKQQVDELLSQRVQLATDLKIAADHEQRRLTLASYDGVTAATYGDGVPDVTPGPVGPAVPTPSPTSTAPPIPARSERVVEIAASSTMAPTAPAAPPSWPPGWSVRDRMPLHVAIRKEGFRPAEPLAPAPDRRDLSGSGSGGDFEKLCRAVHAGNIPAPFGMRGDILVARGDVPARMRDVIALANTSVEARRMLGAARMHGLEESSLTPMTWTALAKQFWSVSDADRDGAEWRVADLIARDVRLEMVDGVVRPPVAEARAMGFASYLHASQQALALAWAKQAAARRLEAMKVLADADRYDLVTVQDINYRRYAVLVPSNGHTDDEAVLVTRQRAVPLVDDIWGAVTASGSAGPRGPVAIDLPKAEDEPLWLTTEAVKIATAAKVDRGTIDILVAAAARARADAPAPLRPMGRPQKQARPRRGHGR